MESTGATVVVRGVYHPPHKEVTDPSNLLHLHIQANTKEALDAAIDEIEKIMREEKVPFILSAFNCFF